MIPETNFSKGKRVGNNWKPNQTREGKQHRLLSHNLKQTDSIQIKTHRH